MKKEYRLLPWHGMLPWIWFKTLFMNRFAVSSSKIRTVVEISLITWLNLLLYWISEAIYGRKARKLQLKHPPIFILGHWRSGTTWLHELLAQDKRFIYPNSIDCVTPRHFLLTSRFLCRKLAKLFPEKRHQDNVLFGLEKPQEDEFALINLGADSPYLEFAFPNQGFRSHTIGMEYYSKRQKERWKKRLDWFVRRLSLKNSDAVIVLKSPTHTSRIKLILELYPDARFIHIARDPRVIIPSAIRNWQLSTDAVSLQNPVKPQEEHVLNMFKKMHEHFEEGKHLIPSAQFHQLRYEDLVKNPIHELQCIYQQLSLGDFEETRSAMVVYLASIKGYETNRYEPTESLIAKIDEFCHDYKQCHGYI